jgi:hypothetical protein
MKKELIQICILLLFGVNANCQSDSIIDKHLMRINNYSVKYSNNYIQEIYLDSNAALVCRNLSASTKRKLITLLMSSDMVLVAHVLLTKMVDGNAAKFKYDYQYDGSTIMSTSFNYNNLKWTVNKAGTVTVPLDDKDYIYQYWKKRMRYLED